MVTGWNVLIYDFRGGAIVDGDKTSVWPKEWVESRMKGQDIEDMKVTWMWRSPSVH